MLAVLLLSCNKAKTGPAENENENQDNTEQQQGEGDLVGLHFEDSFNAYWESAKDVINREGATSYCHNVDPKALTEWFLRLSVGTLSIKVPAERLPKDGRHIPPGYYCWDGALDAGTCEVKDDNIEIKKAYLYVPPADEDEPYQVVFESSTSEFVAIKITCPDNSFQLYTQLVYKADYNYNAESTKIDATVLRQPTQDANYDLLELIFSNKDITTDPVSKLYLVISDNITKDGLADTYKEQSDGNPHISEYLVLCIPANKTSAFYCEDEYVGGKYFNAFLYKGSITLTRQGPKYVITGSISIGLEDYNYHVIFNSLILNIEDIKEQ